MVIYATDYGDDGDADAAAAAAAVAAARCPVAD